MQEEKKRETESLGCNRIYSWQMHALEHHEQHTPSDTQPIAFGVKLKLHFILGFSIFAQTNFLNDILPN